MSERIAQRRKAERKVFIWGWSVAAALHVILFLGWRESREVRVTVPNPDLESVEIEDGRPPRHTTRPVSRRSEAIIK